MCVCARAVKGTWHKHAKGACGCPSPTLSMPIAYGVSATISSGRSILASLAASSRSLVATVDPSSEAAFNSCFSRRRCRFVCMPLLGLCHHFLLCVAGEEARCTGRPPPRTGPRRLDIDMGASKVGYANAPAHNNEQRCCSSGSTNSLWRARSLGKATPIEPARTALKRMEVVKRPLAKVGAVRSITPPLGCLHVSSVAALLATRKMDGACDEQRLLAARWEAAHAATLVPIRALASSEPPANLAPHPLQRETSRWGVIAPP